MKKINLRLFAFLAFLIGIMFSTTMNAQVGFGADFVSRYIWRGSDFGQAPAIQPSLTVSAGGFEIGAWGSYQTARSTATAGADELDLFAGYAFDLGSGSSLSLVVTDYYFPNGGIKFFNFNKYEDPDGGGAHTFEGGLGYTCPESFPLSVALYGNLYSGSDADNTMYFELAYPIMVKEVGVNFFLGGTPGGDTGYYGTTKFNIINLGLTASKEIKITSDFSLPVFGSYIINPYTEQSYFVFGISF